MKRRARSGRDTQHCVVCHCVAKLDHQRVPICIMVADVYQRPRNLHRELCAARIRTGLTCDMCLLGISQQGGRDVRTMLRSSSERKIMEQ